MTVTTSLTSTGTTRPPAPWQLPSLFLDLADAGQVASAHVGSHDGVHDGAGPVRSRWQGLRPWLSAQGAPESMLSALDECTRQPAGRGGTLAAFATADGRHHVEHLASSVGSDHATIGSLPSVLPLLSVRQRHVPTVVVTTRGHGADMLLVEPGVPDLSCQVVGEDLLVSGAAGDGGSRRRLERAERARATNVRAVAECLTWLVDSSDARLVVTDDDGGMSRLLRARLEPHVAGLLVEVRNSQGIRQLAVHGRTLATDMAADDEQAVLAELAAGLADGRACVGSAPTLRAVLAGRAVEVLVAPEAVEHGRTDTPPRGPAGTHRTGWRVAGSWASRVSLTPDLLVQAATARSTVVRTVRDGHLLQGGVGALLRHPPSTGDVPSRPPQARLAIPGAASG